MSSQTEIEKVIGLHDTRAERGDLRIYQRFTEATYPELAIIGQQIHAAGYKAEGFVGDEAIETNGTLTADIDKARGELVEYYLGFEVGESGEKVARSSVRKVGVPFNGTIEDLPAFQLAGKNMDPTVLEALRAVPYPHRTLKEVSAFAHIEGRRSLAGFELLRTLLQDAVGSDEVWIFTMVESNFNSLVRSFGPEMMRQIGEPVLLDDLRVQEDLKLVPAMVDTNLFLEQILKSATDETNSPQARHAYTRSLLYLTEGLAAGDMSDEVAAMVEILRETSDALTPQSPEKLSFSALIRQLNKEPAVWEQPDIFDLSSWADRQEVRRRRDDGRIASTYDAAAEIADELFELQYPELKGDSAARKDFVEMTAGQSDREGVWVNAPWDKSLGHFADKNQHQQLRTFRHRPLVTWDEQKEYLSKTILAAGLSVGSEVVGQLAPAGIGGTMILADYDTISVTNLNRIRAGMPQVGMKKTDLAGIKISELDPFVRQVHFREGITPDLLPEIADLKPDIIFDEVDNLVIKALLRRFAAEQRIPLVMATDADDRSIIDVERHDLEPTKSFNGLLSDTEIDAVIEGKLTPAEKLGLTAKVVGHGNISARLFSSIADPTLGGFPQLGSTAAMGGSLAVRATRAILAGQKMDSGRYVDPQSETLKLDA